jgi:L-alanine-DL-glutamate epimerase-like enolase superfamily enzyme
VKVIAYESLRTAHDWGRPIGDANGVLTSGITPVPILLVHTDEGVTGVGLGAHDDVDRVFRVVEGEDPRGATALYDRMLDAVFKSGHQGAIFGAIGALDMALWDLKAKLAGEPLWRLLGARDRFVPGYASALCMGLDDAQMADVYGEFAARGFRAAKIKGGLDADRDLDRLRLVTEVMSGPHGPPALMLDANECWSAAQAVRHIARLEAEVDLTWIEEPVRRFDADGLAHVRLKVRAAVATGENLTGLEQFRPLLQRQAVDVVQTGSVWGITHFLRVATLAHGFGLPVSPVAYDTNPLAHAAAAIPNHLGLEVQDLRHPTGLTIDHQIADGGVVLGDALGLGIEVDREAVASVEEAAPWGALGGPHVRPERAGLRLVHPDLRRS